MEGRILPIHNEYASGTGKWHMEDTPAVHMYGGTDITKAEAMSKSAEDLTRAIYRSANMIAPVLIEDTNARGHRMPSRIDQNRPWSRRNNSPISQTIRSVRYVSIGDQILLSTQMRAIRCVTAVDRA